MQTWNKRSKRREKDGGVGANWLAALANFYWLGENKREHKIYSHWITGSLLFCLDHVCLMNIILRQPHNAYYGEKDLATFMLFNATGPNKISVAFYEN